LKIVSNLVLLSDFISIVVPQIITNALRVKSSAILIKNFHIIKATWNTPDVRFSF